MSGANGFKVEKVRDENGYVDYKVEPPAYTEAVAEVIGQALENLCAEFLTGQRAWNDFPEESRPWLCHLFLQAIRRAGGTYPKDKVLIQAVRAVEALLAIPGRVKGETAEKRAENARRMVIKDFARRGMHVDYKSLASAHRTHRNRDKKSPR